MRAFEHEVLDFDVREADGLEAMKRTLREWGEAGFEIVSVLPISRDADMTRVFLKREVSPDRSREGEVS